MLMKKILLALFVFISVGCHQSDFVADDGDSEPIAPARSPSATSANDLIYQNKLKVSLLSGYPLFNSLATVTGHTAPTTSQIQVYDQVGRLLAAGQDLDLVNGPMLVAIATLASPFCDNLIDIELRGSRKFFAGLDLSRSPANISADQYLESINRMAFSFWGRSISEEEAQVLQEYRTEFSGTAGATARNLMMSTCTVMLTSFDFLTF